MSNVICAIFESHWDGSSVIATPCKIDLDTNEVHSIERVDCNECCEHLDYEDVIFNGKVHKVVPQEEYENQSDVFYYKN